MSIPRIAIERPVTMFMISMVIILLGGISLTRLPVDLMPDTQMPTITVRVNYSGVGPLEMEELVTRPIEQAVSAVAGLERVDSTSSEGNANIRLNFAWGTDLSRGGRRSPHPPRPRPRPHAGRRRPAHRVQVRLDLDADHGHWRRGRLRPGDAARTGPERPVAAPRARRRRRRGDHQRRPAPPDSRRPVAREDHRAQPVARPHRPDSPHREPEHPARRNQRRRPHAAAAQPGPVHQHRGDQEPGGADPRGRAGLPARHRRRHATPPKTAARSCASTAPPASACR